MSSIRKRTKSNLQRRKKRKLKDLKAKQKEGPNPKEEQLLDRKRSLPALLRVEKPLSQSLGGELPPKNKYLKNQISKTLS